MATEIIVRLYPVSVTKALAAAAQYHAEDVLSQSAAAGTVWTFASIARSNGKGGKIVRATISSETTNVTPRLTLFLFKTTPTSAVNDHAANTAVLNADIAKYVGKIDFPALEDVGGNSEAVCSPSTPGGLPLAFMCAVDSTTIYGILATRDVFTQTATDDMTITLLVEQN